MVRTVGSFGAHHFLLAWRHEGMEIAEWANSLGMDAFILKYRVPNDGSIALMDAQRAVSWMRANAATLQIDPAAMLLGPKGGHGYGSRRTGRDNDTWPDVAATWLKRTLGF